MNDVSGGGGDGGGDVADGGDPAEGVSLARGWWWAIWTNVCVWYEDII